MNELPETTDLPDTTPLPDANALPGAIGRLNVRLQELERRVGALERSTPVTASAPGPQSGIVESAPVPGAAPFLRTGTVLSVLGKALLGIAGAYLLRALAESSLLPKPLAAAVAIAYALLWLIAAARTEAEDWPSRTIYACTSAVILAPMLWELTMRFNVISGAMTAAVLGGYVAAAFALTWMRHRPPVLWVASTTAVALGAAFALSSHRLADVFPVFLLMALSSEIAAKRNREPGVRVLAAAAADLAIWALIFIYSSPQAARTDYPTLGATFLLLPGLALFLIYGSSIVVRMVLRGEKITAFETIQTTIAFVLAAAGLMAFGPPASRAILGLLCLLLSGAGYAAVFALFDRASGRGNYTVLATWSAALLLAGAFLCLPPFWTAVLLSAAAIAATAAGARLGRVALSFHGALYLLAAAAASGLLRYDLGVLAGNLPPAPSSGVWLVSFCAVLCYAAAGSRPGQPWKPQVLQIVFAALAACSGSALLAAGLIRLVAISVIPGAHHLAFVRTFTLCAAALALAFSGAHWRRLELTRVGYAALALVAVKLVAEDLRLGHLEYIAGSIFLFALTLIALPRIARMGQRI